MEWSLVNGHLTISGEITHTTDISSDWPWHSQRNNIQSVSFSNAYFTSGSNAYCMFSNCYSLTSLDFSSFDTSNVENMSRMFYYCDALTSLDLSNFDTSKVTNMTYIFGFCESLTSLDLSNFNTSNVTNMSCMFHTCSKLISLDLNSFDTSNVEDMSFMFYGCNALTSLDLSNFDTSKVTNMQRMFFNCPVTVPVLYVSQSNCITTNFVSTSTKNIFLVRSSEVSRNTQVQTFWRNVAASYNNVHFEYDDTTRPTITPEINRGKEENNQWEADESGNVIKINLNEQVYNNNKSNVLPNNSCQITYVIPDLTTPTDYTITLSDNLAYITLNTNPDKQYNLNVILTDLSDISITYSIIIPGVFAMIEFKAGGYGMSIGKICERNGLEISIPTTIGKGLLPPVDQQGNFDLTNYQLVIGKYNEQKKDPLFVIGNGTDETHRSNLMEVGDNHILIGNINKAGIDISTNESTINNIIYYDGSFTFKLAGQNFAYITFGTNRSPAFGIVGPTATEGIYSEQNAYSLISFEDDGSASFASRYRGTSLRNYVNSIEITPDYVQLCNQKTNLTNTIGFIRLTPNNDFSESTLTIISENVMIDDNGNVIAQGMAGQIIMFAGSTAPTGWLICNGQAVSRTTYAKLFSVIGTTWGTGDGSSTFNIPDLRGRTPIGAGTGSGLTARTLGGTVGAETVKLTAAQSGVPAHTHPASGDNYFLTAPDSTNADAGSSISGSGYYYPRSEKTGWAHPRNTGSSTAANASSAHNNMQPSAVVNFIICTGKTN